MMSAVGDAVHALPVVTALKRARPGARLTWVLQPGPASLVRGHPDVDEIVPFERARGWRAFLDVRRALAGRDFDLALDLQVYFKASVVTALGRAPVKLGFDRARARDLNWLVTNRKIPAHAPQHVQEQYFEFLAHLGISAEPVTWGLAPWPEERARQRETLSRFDRPIAALNVGTSSREKDWIPERWARVADALHEEYGLQPVLVGGRSAGELETERRIRAAARAPIVSTLGNSFREMVGVLDGAALVVALDSAPLHLSVALGRPVVSLMGYTDPRRTGPYRDFHDLIVDAYHDPGESGPPSVARRPGRMERITVEQVLERVRRWSERYASTPAGAREGRP
jgi:heptosyltransferase I